MSHKIIRLIKKFRQLLNVVNLNVRNVISNDRMTECFNYFFVYRNTCKESKRDAADLFSQKRWK